MNPEDYVKVARLYAHLAKAHCEQASKHRKATQEMHRVAVLLVCGLAVLTVARVVGWVVSR
jgi:hypothetical protein